MHRRHKNSDRSRLRGFTLLEVLIALMVLSIGLLGLAALQARGLKFNHDAHVRSQATVLAYDIIERMRAVRNSDAAAQDLLGFSGAPAVACDPVTPTAANDLKCWQDTLAARLPGGNGTVAVNGTDANLFDITVRWADREILTQADCVAAFNRQWDAGAGLCRQQQTWTVWP